MKNTVIMVITSVAIFFILLLSGCSDYNDPEWVQMMATGVEYNAHDIVGRNER